MDLSWMLLRFPREKNKGTHHIVRHYWSGLIRYHKGHAKGTLQGKKNFRI